MTLVYFNKIELLDNTNSSRIFKYVLDSLS